LKKRRRVELHIEHREVTVFALSGVTAVTPSARTVPVEAIANGLAFSLACPTCGSQELLPLAETVASAAMDLRALQQGMDNGTVHLHRSQDGAWWICGGSIQQA